MWGNGYYGYPMMGGYGEYGLFHIISSVFWIIVVVALVMLAIRALRGKPLWQCHHRMHDEGGTALDILKERYAKGEIDKAEFEEKKKDLSA